MSPRKHVHEKNPRTRPFREGTYRVALSRKHPVFAFPIKIARINWAYLLFLRPLVLHRYPKMPPYLFKPEVVQLLAAETDPMIRLILDLLWTTGAKISEVLALTPRRVITRHGQFGVILSSHLPRPGRPTDASRQRSTQRFIPLFDPLTQERLKSYLSTGRFKPNARLFPISRHTVNRHLQAANARTLQTDTHIVPFSISTLTLRHAFGIHVLLHGRHPDYVTELLGLTSTDSIRHYTHAYMFKGVDYLTGVKFH